LLELIYRKLRAPTLVPRRPSLWKSGLSGSSAASKPSRKQTIIETMRNSQDFDPGSICSIFSFEMGKPVDEHGGDVKHFPTSLYTAKWPKKFIMSEVIQRCLPCTDFHISMLDVLFFGTNIDCGNKAK
jgi:hypothetical protein